MATTDTKSDQYRKILIKDGTIKNTVDTIKLDDIRTGDEKIDSTCKIQLDENQYNALKNYLNNELIKRKQLYDANDKILLMQQQKKLNESLATVKNKLAETESEFNKLKTSYDNLTSIEIGQVTREDQNVAIGKIDLVRNGLKQLKKVIDGLSGSFVSSDVFVQTDAILKEIKSNPASTKDWNEDILLEDQHITGNLILSESFFSRRLESHPCELVSVNVVKKVYKVKYQQEGKKMITTIHQSNVCLVYHNNKPTNEKLEKSKIESLKISSAKKSKNEVPTDIPPTPPMPPMPPMPLMQPMSIITQ